MDPLIPDIVAVDAEDPRVAALIRAHLTLMRASSPACCVHAMDAGGLSKAGARFYAVFDGDDAVAMGALKRLGSGDGEIKSMHVRQDHRGAGLADRVLGHLLDAARGDGMARVWLETGSQDAFFAARAFYGRHGFQTCGPFEGYGPDVNSVFMMRTL